MTTWTLGLDPDGKPAWLCPHGCGFCAYLRVEIAEHEAAYCSASGARPELESALQDSLESWGKLLQRDFALELVQDMRDDYADKMAGMNLLDDADAAELRSYLKAMQDQADRIRGKLLALGLVEEDGE